jgi:hypothetical protein
MGWKTYQLLAGARTEKLPKVAGVYAIYFDETLVYIGQSCNVANRLTGHQIRYGYGKNIITPWGDVPEETLITVKVGASRRMGDWAMREIRLINRLKPMFNTHHRNRRAA